jgi:hypothetical protein
MAPDCHAEVLARRQLLIWLLNHARAHPDSPLPPPVWLVVSKPPCGDCSIVGGSDSTGGRKVVRLADGAARCPPHAEVIHGYAVSKHRNGVDDVEVGALRVKPGKGHPSLIMSCSDKIAKWAALGIAPAHMLGPGRLPANVLLAGLVVSDRTADAAALQRGIGRAAAVLGSPAPAVLLPAPPVVDEIERCVSRPSAPRSSAASLAWRLGRVMHRSEQAASGGALHQLNSKSGLPLGMTEKAADRGGDGPISLCLPATVAGSAAAEAESPAMGPWPGCPSSVAFRAALLLFLCRQAAASLAQAPHGEVDGGQGLGSGGAVPSLSWPADFESATAAVVTRHHAAKHRLLSDPAFAHWVARSKPAITFAS